MSVPYLATKISLPILRQQLVPRRNVFGQLNAGLREGHLLFLISAPAGYGKTAPAARGLRGCGGSASARLVTSFSIISLAHSTICS